MRSPAPFSHSALAQSSFVMAVVSKLPSDKHINIFLDAIMPDMPEDASMIIDCNVCHKIVKHTLNYRKHPDSLGSFQNCGRWFYHVSAQLDLRAPATNIRTSTVHHPRLQGMRVRVRGAGSRQDRPLRRLL